jgi:hypothetical protein
LVGNSVQGPRKSLESSINLLTDTSRLHRPLFHCFPFPEIACAHALLEHPVNLPHAPPLHLGYDIPTHEHPQGRARRKHIAHLSSQVPLIGVELVRQHEARDGAGQRGHEPADALRLCAELQRRRLGRDGEARGPCAQTRDGDGEHHARGGPPHDRGPYGRAVRDAHGEPEQRGGRHAVQDERAACDARDQPYGSEVRDEARHDADDQEDDARAGRHVDELQEVRGFGKELEAEYGRQAVGPHYDKGAADVSFVKALCKGRCPGRFLVFDIREYLGDDGTRVCPLWIQACLRGVRIVHLAFPDEPGRGLWDQERDDDGHEGEGPLTAKHDRIPFALVQRPENHKRARELAKQRDGGEERHARAAQNGGQDLRHVRLRRGHDGADGEALQQLAHHEAHATPRDVRGEVRHVHDRDADSRHQRRDAERAAASDFVAKEAAQQGAGHGADGRGDVPEREPGGGQNPFALVEDTEVFSGVGVSKYLGGAWDGGTDWKTGIAETEPTTARSKP